MGARAAAHEKEFVQRQAGEEKRVALIQPERLPADVEQTQREGQQAQSGREHGAEPADGLRSGGEALAGRGRRACDSSAASATSPRPPSG